ncbi:MAG TPA: methyltransferase domain-containing protein [Candidatus Binatia bacterium]|nr:methyltransferase domain-containing protein [Candidatus Binatia bacterium]
MQRVDAPELLDSGSCPPAEIAATLKTLDRINRWFGGVGVTQRMVERVASRGQNKRLSLLEVAAGSGAVPETVRQYLAGRGIELEITLLDRMSSHLPRANGKCGRLAADGLAMPFRDNAFDIASCNLFAHHLSPPQLCEFVGEAMRISRRAVVINDLVRHPLHLGIVYASQPIMSCRTAWLDGLTSVRRSYVPHEMSSMLSAIIPPSARIEIVRGFLYRMGVIIWKKSEGEN